MKTWKENNFTLRRMKWCRTDKKGNVSATEMEEVRKDNIANNVKITFELNF